MELATLRAKHAALAPVLTERSRRVWAATEAQAIGYGGTALVARATGIATSTIQRGLRELTADEPLAGGRTRRAGGGRKRAIDLDATLLRDLDALVEPTAPGDPDSPLRWTCQSARTLAVALDGLGHRVSHTVVAELLHGLGYSLQGNAKTREGRQRYCQVDEKLVDQPPRCWDRARREPAMLGIRNGRQPQLDQYRACRVIGSGRTRSACN